MAPVIGVFDSGVGGLTVLRELLHAVPAADYLYFGDTARLPYGSKSAHTVSRYANSAVQFLEHHGAQMLVIACNTATALAFDEIRAATRLPVVGVVEPGAERASEISKSRKAAVIATEATIASHAYRKALEKRGIDATEKACPLLAPLVEEGWTDHPVTEQVAHIYLDEIFNDGARGADVLMLGCTHYPLLRPLLRRVAPPEIQIVDSAECTARQVVTELAAMQPCATQPGKTPSGADRPGAGQSFHGTTRFFVTDSAEKFRRLGSRFLGQPIHEVALVDIEEKMVE